MKAANTRVTRAAISPSEPGGSAAPLVAGDVFRGRIVALDRIRGWLTGSTPSHGTRHLTPQCNDSRSRGRPWMVSDEQIEAVITRTLESAPANATHWSTRSLAAERA